MTRLRSFLGRVSVLTMVVLRTCHGFYMPGVRPHEFVRGEEVPMKVNALTSIHTQVRIRLTETWRH
jgi:transmembrane 9 superfamily protein 2/4